MRRVHGLEDLTKSPSFLGVKPFRSASVVIAKRTSSGCFRHRGTLQSKLEHIAGGWNMSDIEKESGTDYATRQELLDLLAGLQRFGIDLTFAPDGIALKYSDGEPIATRLLIVGRQPKKYQDGKPSD